MFLTVESVLYFAMAIISALMGYFLNFFLARELTMENFGLYAFLFAVISIGSVLGQSGVPMRLIRLYSVDNVGLGHYSIKHLKALYGYLSIISVVGLIVLIVVQFLFGFMLDYLLIYFIVMSLILIKIISSLFRSQGARLQAQFMETQDKTLLVALLLFFIYLNLDVFSKVSNLFILYQIALIGLLLFASIWSIFKGRIYFRFAHLLEFLRGFELWKQSVSVGIIGAFFIVCTQFDLIVIGLINGNLDSAQYKVATVIAGIMMLPAGVVGGFMLRDIARFKSDKEELTEQIKKGARLVFLMGLFTTFMFFAFGKMFISFTFGSGYLESYGLALILVVFNQISLYFGMVTSVASVTGVSDSLSKTLVILILVNLCTDIVMVYLFGPFGAALATGVVLLFYKWYVFKLIQKELALNCSVL